MLPPSSVDPTARTAAAAAASSVAAGAPLVLVCAWCRSEWDGVRWIPDARVQLPTDAVLTHGMCPDCARSFVPALRQSA